VRTGSWLMPKLVGLQRVKRLSPLAFVEDLTGRLAAGPPVAPAQTKALLNEGADCTLRAAPATEAGAQIVNVATVDAAAAGAAFAARRAPSFTGRWSLTTSESE